MHSPVRKLLFSCGLLLLAEIALQAAGIGPSGYTNDFSAQPSEFDWATWSRPGAQGDTYDPDADVNAIITASGVTNQTVLRANNPPGLLGPATWSSVGFYLQTRPLTNRYTALMAKFVNNTGSNATQITISYLLTIAGSVAPEDVGKGTRFYYSLSGESNSWVNVPVLNTVASNASSSSVSAPISLNWPIGGNLFLLWADDNAIPTTDVANQIDNFSLLLTAATPPLVILAPADGTSQLFGDPLILTATLNGGVPPYTVTFYTNGQSVGSLSSTYATNLGVVPVGSYTSYVHAIDSGSPATQANSTTNVITILPNPLSVTLTSPTEGQIATAGQPFPLTATASIGAPVTISSVEFFFDGVSAGVDNAAPFGASVNPALGNHTAYAIATDSLGRTSFSTTNSMSATPPANAAVVGPGGYTNDFATLPPTTDWATASRAGAAADAYDMDSDVNAVITADGVTGQLFINPGGPPGANPLATWSQSGQYMQTRPTQNRFTALMGKFQNNTGTNATEINVSYLYAVLAGANEEPSGGTRVYYSLTGAGDWINLPALNTVAVNTGQTPKSTNVTVNWPHGANLYLLWADDNANAFGTDAPHQIDNFSLMVTAGSPTAIVPEVSLIAPTNNASFFAPSSVTLTATATDSDGTVTNVEFFVDGVKLGEDASSPYTINWNNPPLGPHVLHAVATDNQGARGQSTNVSITVYDAAGRPFAQITSPTNGTSVEGPTNLAVTANALASTGVTNVEFYAGTTLIGSSTGSTPDAAKADYQFQNTLTSSVGTAPALANLGPNAFTAASVDGQTRTVLRFAQNDGVSLGALSSVVPTNVYTVVVLFAFDQITSWRRLIDFKNGTSEIGLYTYQAGLNFYPVVFGPPNIISAGAFVQVAISRDNAGNVAAYLDGVQQFTFVDSNNDAVVNANNVLRFFRDDSFEATAGAVARIRLYDVALPPSQIAALDRLPGTGAYGISWNAPFGSHALRAVAVDANGLRGTSAVVNVTITIPPTNTVAPTIAGQNPLASATVTTLNSLQVTFSERVIGVDAGDLLVNGVPAFFLNGSLSNYTFFFNEPPFGTVSVTWATNHGITDIGYPSNLAFNATAPGATWTYNFIDARPPTIFSRVPPQNAIVSNLTEATVVFSEPVSGVDASDLLINGAPAFGLTSSNMTYTFSFSQPAAGAVFFTWSGTHGIADLAASPNPFNGSAAGASWSVLLDNRTVLVNSNSNWQFIKGLAEASTPIDAWRQLVFDDSSWSNALAPFFFGDPYNSVTDPGTLLSDMQGGYTSIYLRKKFNVFGAAAVTNLLFNFQIDDGLVVWINGFEVLRFNAPGGDVPYNGLATQTAQEPGGGGGQRGAAYFLSNLVNTAAYLLEGENVIAVHAFNQSLAQSTDFGFNAQLYAYLPDTAVVAPRVASVTPSAGELFYLTNITVKFSESVSNVNASDLLINGVTATGMVSTTNTTYTFSFAQPAFGPVSVTWAAGHGIQDFDDPPKAFDGAGPGATFQYSLVNPSAPTVASQSPLRNAAVNVLTQINVLFSEAVVNVNASDLLVNGLPATAMSGSGANYTFTFAQPAYGAVSIGWAGGHGIVDTEPAMNPFDGTRQGNVWSYTLVDQTPPAIVAVSPAPGSQVTNVTQVTVTFSEAVTGVNASDLRVNGVAATGVSGTNATYTFTFAQPNATLVNFTWINTHGIRDLAPVPNPFNSTAPGSTWSYTTPDTLAPSVAVTDPAPFITVRSLAQVRITFTEPVVGVGTNDLLVNNVPALSVSGSGAGPYTFGFLPSSNGVVTVRWATNSGIVDLATPTPNAFAGGQWTYTLDPSATFAGKVLINEIMFNPRGGLPSQEWIELRNVTANAIGLAGWRLTRGVNFNFPSVSIAPNGYLVVAADLASFQANYPTVVNVIGGWTGSLANSDETIELETALGESVNSVHYATEGDWARRERGHGATPVESITRNGGTATVRIFGHGYNGNDRIMITGADQPEYNGIFAIAGVGVSTFNITVPGAPASPATGPMIARHVIDDNNSGWSWFSGADGFGSSLELVNSALPNSTGQNWLTSTNFGGTPGSVNSVATPNVAPLVLDVTHFPPVPRSTETVSISARVRDELGAGVSNVTLFYRDHTFSLPGPFVGTNMFDDGAHADGLNGDGLFGAVLPAFANGTVIEFYVQASDTSGLSRTWPAPTWDTNGVFAQLANALYQVDDEVISNLMPTVRIVMTGTERSTFPPGQRQSDAEANNTFINTDGTGTQIRYLAGARVRGAGSRTRTPPNNRINIPNDNRWKGLQAVNLNGQFVHAQLMGAAVAQKAGVPASPAHVIQYRINGVNPAPIGAPINGSGNGAGYGTFIMVQPVNGDLAEELFPNDGDGNVYRASIGQHSAQFLYRTNPDQFLADGYFKTSNQTENDWADLVALSYAFSAAGSDAEYFAAMSTNVNVEVWMRYFALGSLLNYSETSLFNGRGDDYALYRGVTDARFVPIGHDFDTVFGQGDAIDTGGNSYYPLRTNASIFIMMNPPNNGGGGFGGNAPNIAALRRFMTNEQFAPIFFREVKRLCDTVFAPGELSPMFDQLLTWPNGPTLTTINEMKNHAQNRRDNALAQIPLTLTVGSTLGTSNGFLYSTTPAVTLFGQSHAIETRRVLVNGNAAARSPWEARWTNTVALQPGVNRVLVQSLDSNNVEFARATVDIWFDDGNSTSVSGAIATDTVWSAAAGPYQVTANVTVNAGVTLTIQAGTTVFLNGGVDIVVANGGRLLAEGTDTARIYISAVPGGAAWGGITINGAPGSPESRITYAHITGNNDTAIDASGSEVFLDHLTFGTTNRRYIDLDGASFVVQHCVFPATTAGLEPVHGTAGIRAGGHGIVRRNFWGRISGYNDSFDFTGGNRPGPILQVNNNVFMGSDDDLLDLDGTDAWIEGNIFLHAHRNGSPDSASAVSGGNDSGQTSEITVIGNLIYDVDQAANAKQGNFYTMVNNTIVNQNDIGSEDTNTAVVILADDGTAAGVGVLLEGNIISLAEGLTRNATNSLVTYTNNLFHQVGGAAWSGPGGNNATADPLFVRVPQLSETTNFSSWEEAQVLWQWFSLRTGSPASATGPNGRDKGAVASTSPLGGDRAGVRGVSISGEPVGTTPFNTATLIVDPNRTSSGVPTNGFPNGSGYTHYKWRLDGGAWSAETPTATPISLTGLSGGAHSVEVVGKNDAGFYQDDPIFGEDAVVTVSRTWVVLPGSSPLRINEVLASNGGAVNHFGTTPDVIELYNASDAPVNLTGVRLTDELDDPDKFIFPSGASIPARGYLVVYANAADGTPGYHLGFGLSGEGESLYLFNAASAGGALIDSVSFGLQLTDLSVGRLADGAWTLTQPTFGAVNRAAQLGDPRALRINEWLANAQPPFDNDFVELYNGDSLPVALGGLYLTDNALGWPTRHAMPPLTFMAGNSYLRLVADGDASAGADHLNFSLTSEEGAIAVMMWDSQSSSLQAIDCVVYQPQQPNISQGRNPNGGMDIVFFDTPTPGAPNPLVTGPAPFGGALVINEVLANNAALAENGRTPDWVELYNGTTNTIDLSDFSLTDSTLLPRKFAFSNNTQIAAGGYLRILCDDGRPATNNNTGFGLRAAGGAVYLFNSPANGSALLSSIIYGIQTPNLSIGRVPSGSANWVLNTPTPDAANNAVPTLGSVANLKVNEWMADPPSGEDDWIEIYNSNPLPVALGGLHLTDDLNNRTKHQIAALSFIGTGTNAFLQFHADGNTGAGADHTSFSLRAAGEAVGISTAVGALIDGATFGQQVVGVSQGRFPDGATNIVSFPGTDSPGASNWRRLTTIAINEVLSHTDEPLEDAIELRNLTGAAIDLGGWWLSDDESELRKYQIPSPTLVPANGFVVIYENVFTNAETAAIPFAISSQGDEVVLSAATNNALTGFRASVDFGAAANAVSFGRYVTSDAREEFVPMSARTFGADDPGSVVEFRTGRGTNNAYPRVGPIVISEVMYHPPDLGTNDNTRDEFIELRNTSTVAVPLYDTTNGWRLRDAVDFDFTPGTVIGPGATLLVVSFDPVNNPSVLAEFRAQYQLVASQPIVGPYSGKLANDSDDIELRRPDAPNTNSVPYILVERVRYFDVSPWPNSADGTGLSLHRVSETGFGNDPTNWVASTPTPGPVAASFDTDGDGMPDAWEIDHGLDRLNPADALFDVDGDGLTNLQEYQLGTDPRDAGSGLRLNIAGAGGANLVLSFDAIANFSYTIVYADALGAAWQPLQTFSAAPTNRVAQMTVSATGQKRFYRLALGVGSGGTASINSISKMGGGQMSLIFQAPANQSWTVLFTPNLGTAWAAVTNFPSAPTNRTIQAIVAAPGASGFYRVSSP